MNDKEKMIFAASIFTAKAEGKITQWFDQSAGKWFQCNPFSCAEGPFETPERWRIKPEPVTRPWSKPEDVPGPVCYLRSTGYEEGWSMIIGARQDPVLNHGNGILLGGFRHEGVCVTWSELATHEYSTDRKTWFKCEVQEESK